MTGPSRLSCDTDAMPAENFENHLSFIREAQRLKDVLRSGHTAQGRRENTAEHTWRLCPMVLVFAPKTNPQNIVMTHFLISSERIPKCRQSALPNIAIPAKAGIQRLPVRKHNGGAKDTGGDGPRRVT